MFDMSWGEIMVIGGVALIVIGPKDLPKALRTVGQMTAKVRRMAGEFQSQFSEAMREAELQDVRKEVEGLNRDVTAATSAAFNPIQTLRDEIKGAAEPKTASTPDADIWGINPEPVSTAAASAEPVPLGLVTPVPVEEARPVPHVAAATADGASADHAFPETQPLVPLAVEGPAPAPAERAAPQRDAAP